MNCKPTPSQPQPCLFYSGSMCTDEDEYVNRDTGKSMCRYNTSAVHISEYRKNSDIVESPVKSPNTASPKLPSDKELHIYAMAIVNHTAERMGVAVDVRQANNDECDKFAIAKIKESLVNFGRC